MDQPAAQLTKPKEGSLCYTSDNTGTTFLKTTSLHGCRNIPDRTKHVVHRVLWFLVVMSMVVILFYNIYFLNDAYFQYNTLTTVKMMRPKRVDFPAVTICNNSPYDKTRLRNDTDAVDSFFSSWSHGPFYKYDFSWNTSEGKAVEAIDVHQFHEQLSHRAEDFIFHSKWNVYHSLNARDDFEAVDTFSGRCFLFNGPRYFAKHGRPRELGLDGIRGGLTLFLNISQEGYFSGTDLIAGAMIFVHEPHDSPYTLKGGVALSPGFATFVKIKPVKINFLPYPYKAYSDTYCTHTGTKYSYLACARDCLLQYAAEQCGCRAVYQKAIPDRPVCSFRETSDCFLPAMGLGEEKLQRGEMCACPRPCKMTSYETDISFASFPSDTALDLYIRKNLIESKEYARKNLLKVVLYFPEMEQRVVTYVPEYSATSIFGTLGGEMGLFLGASLVTVVEIMEAAVLGVISCILNKYCGNKLANIHDKSKVDFAS